MQITINPTNTEIMYAGTGGFFGGSLYKSTNSGLSWTNLYRNEQETPGLQDGITSLAIDPSNPNIIYSGTASRGLIIKSTDAGYSWVVTGLVETGQIIKSLSIDNYSTLSIYAAISHSGFFRSLDGGTSWQTFNQGLIDTVYGIKLVTNPINTDLFGIASFKDSTGIYITGLLINRYNNSIWEIINTSKIIISSYSDVYITGDGKFIYFGTYRGVYRARLN